MLVGHELLGNRVRSQISMVTLHGWEGKIYIAIGKKASSFSGTLPPINIEPDRGGPGLDHVPCKVTGSPSGSTLSGWEGA